MGDHPRGLTATAVLALVTVGSASPAKALGPPPDGMYAFTEAGVPAATWKIAALGVCNVGGSLSAPCAPVYRPVVRRCSE